MTTQQHSTMTFVLLLMCASVTLVHCFYPVLSHGVPYSKKYYYRESKPQCSNYMEECTPWKTQCCGGMGCLNLRKGFCLSPIERCFCQKQNDQGYDTQ